ncbi:hypothetical protein [Kitasatospora aureofaciens]|uniref:hypothetical protein n=1 Tax=Kitasatospora aureofaciens TaxID=1894 RepID=UPI001C484AD7|nr:hypothetical protein [Kitasatospora aureofaciens]MBV6698725.1 hypothetical protein [Kitasatospora aureofaciens]
MSTEDEFEEELAIRLGTRAAGVGGSPPLAELREAGRRRARRRGVVRAVTAVAVLAVGAGVLTQLGGGSGTGRTGVAGVGVPSPGSPSPLTGAARLRGAESDELVKTVLACQSGPSSLRTPGGGGMTGLPSASSSGLPSSGLPSGPPTSARFTPTMTGAPSSLSSDQAGQADLVHAGEAVEKMAREQYADHYFSTCQDASTHTLYVMRNPGSGLDAAVTRTVADWPGVKLEFRAAAGYPQQLRLAKEIRAEAGDWAATKGVHIRSVQIANDGAGVIVETPQADTAREELVRHFGRLVVEVRP